MGNKYTLQEATFQNCFCLPSEKGPTLKGKHLLPQGANSFFYMPLSEGTVCKKTNMKPQKVVSLVKSTRCINHFNDMIRTLF